MIICTYIKQSLLQYMEINEEKSLFHDVVKKNEYVFFILWICQANPEDFEV